MSRALSVHFLSILARLPISLHHIQQWQTGWAGDWAPSERIRIDWDSSKAVRRGCMRWKDVHLLCNYSQYYHKYTNHIKSINIEVRSDCKNNII